MYRKAFSVGSRLISFRFYVCEPRDVPPMVYFNMSTDTIFLLQQLPSPEDRRCKKFGVKSCCNKNLMSVCTLKQNIGRTSCGFIKSNRNMSKSDCKCSPRHTYRLNQLKWTFPRKYQKVIVVFFPRWANGLPSVYVVAFSPHALLPIILDFM